MSVSRVWVGASRIVAVLAMLLFVTCAVFVPRAFAAGDFATYQAGNGWELAYSVSDEGFATIEDVTAAGSGKLVVPAQIEGHDVVAFAAKSFYNEGGSDFTAKLAEIEIPNTVTTFGEYAFMGCGLKSITIPASVQAIPSYCFGGCTSLSEVVFEGASMDYFGDAAFSGCTAIKRLDVPELTKTFGNETYRIGRKCFYRCTSLETIVFHGSVNTFKVIARENSTTPTGDYISNIDCFNFCDSLQRIVYYCKKSAITSGTGTTSTYTRADGGAADVYQTLAFYGSAEDSANCVNPVYTITCKETVKALDILNGTVDAADIWEEWGERPMLGDDMTWGIQWDNQDNSRVYANTLLSDTYNAIPVSKGDLAYGWVSSDDIDTFRDTVSPTGSMGAQNFPIYYLDDKNKVFGLDKLVAHLPGGDLADPSTYKIKIQKATSTQLDRATVATYNDIEAPDSTGYYRVRAEGTSGTSTGTHTAWVIIEIQSFSPTIKGQMDSDTAVRLGRAAQVVSIAKAGTAVCGVVVPASDWRYQLIGSGLAGVGNGVVLYDNGTDYSARAVTAFAESKATSLQVVGSTAAVPESASPSSEVYLMDFLNERNLQNKTRYSKDSTIQELADQVYTTIRRLQDNGNDVYGDGWGTTAIVVSPACCIDTLPIAQVAYDEKAPVFFLQSDGSLSSADLGYLKNDGFDKIIVAGDSTYVSDASVASIASATGIAPTRMFDAGSNSLDACLAYLEGAERGTADVVIAATNDPANVTSGALIAAATGGTLLTCSSTADSKRIQDYLYAIITAQGQSSVATLYLLGDFSNVDVRVKERFSNMWSAPESTVVGVDDSYEMGDYVYVIHAGNKAQCAFVRNPDLTDAVVENFTYQGTSYMVEAPLAGAFSSSVALKSVTFNEPSITNLPAEAFAGAAVESVDLGSKITSVGDAAFENCEALETVSGPSVTTIGARAFCGCAALSSAPMSKVTKVGANAFESCTALKKVKLPKAMSIGASAFKDCSALSSAEAPAAKSLGASAFSGCKALKSFSSAKVTSIGSSAFEGCKKLGTASFTAAGLNKVGARAFFGCKVLKRLTFKTTKLTAGKVGANAFKGMPASTKVYVPKAKVKAYRKFFTKKGLAKKTSVVGA